MAKITVKINDKFVKVGFEPFKPILRLSFGDTRIKVYSCVTEHGSNGFLARSVFDLGGRSDVFSDNLDTLTRECCLKVVTFAHYISKYAKSNDNKI